MKYQALITLDLDGVSSDERKKFYEHLEKKHWVKLAKLTTAWKCTFKEDVKRENAVSTIKRRLSDAAQYANIDSYNAAFQLYQGNVELVP